MSARRLQVLELLSHGLSNREIALRLQCSEETVKSHLKHITKELGARNRTHIVGLAFRKGLL